MLASPRGHENVISTAAVQLQGTFKYKISISKYCIICPSIVSIMMPIQPIGSQSLSKGPPAWFADTVRIDPSSQKNAGCLSRTTQLLFSNCTRVMVLLHSLSPLNYWRKRLSLPTLLCGDSKSKSLPTSRHHNGYRASGHFRKLIWVTRRAFAPGHQ